MKVGLYSPMGTGNLGDASIQEAVIHHLRTRLPGVEIVGFSLNAEDTSLRHGIPSFPISRVHHPSRRFRALLASTAYTALLNNVVVQIMRRTILRIPQEIFFTIQSYRRVRRLDLVVFSGGGQLDDEWGGVWGHPYTLLRWSILARLARVPVLFVSVGAGPLSSWLSRLFVRRVLGMAAYRSFRDKESREFLARIGFHRSDPVIPDLAHSLPVSEECRGPIVKRTTPVVGISPFAFGGPLRWREQRAAPYCSYLEKLAGFVGWLAESNISVVFFPTAVPSDQHAIDDLKEVLKERYGLVLNTGHPAVTTLSELLSQMATVDLVVASRYHGVLLSFVLHKPVIALSYHPKVTSLMHDMGQERFCLDIGSVDLGTLKDSFLSLWANIDTARTEIIKREAEFRTLLERQYDVVLANVIRPRQAGGINVKPSSCSVSGISRTTPDPGVMHLDAGGRR